MGFYATRNFNSHFSGGSHKLRQVVYRIFVPIIFNNAIFYTIVDQGCNKIDTKKKILKFNFEILRKFKLINKIIWIK